ncbi:MAG: ribosome biogenesis GTPase YlqF [Lactobacillus sp.]|uniref:ribosome biogenesis GTPase YlqF n=1 Tax=Bombilactobacillus bombi TaxID=1303590 RepID=UPI0035EE934F|nr:ribosome biogenesis GTPase YlqF [Lactobacillus sp.]
MATIQWYPGHMNKAKNQIQEHLKLVDAVLEIRDARLPLSSANPVLDQLIQSKKRIIILNKQDLADSSQTKKWQEYLHQQQIMSLAIDAQHTNHLQIIVQALEKLMADKLQKFRRSGVKNYTIRAMCIGIPNVGKSTILNKLAGKNVAVTGNRPGVTKNQNWIKTKSQIELLDTPGVLWPKIDDQTVGLKLALSGAIKDSLVSAMDLAIFALEYWQHYYSPQLQAAYHLNNTDVTLSSDQLLIKLTQQFGFKDDYERTALKIIQDVRKGVLGRYTLDMVNEIE